MFLVSTKTHCMNCNALMSKGTDTCPECGFHNVNPARVKRRMLNIPLVPFLVFVATAALTLITIVVAVTSISPPQSEAFAHPTKAPKETKSPDAPEAEELDYVSELSAQNCNIYRVDSSNYPDVDIYFDLRDEYGNLDSDINMDGFEIVADSIGGLVTSKPSVSNLKLGVPTSVIFVDTSESADLVGSKQGIEGFYADQANSSKYVEIYYMAKEVVPRSLVSSAKSKPLPLRAQDVIEPLYDSLYIALLQASFTAGPKTFTAIISTPDTRSVKGISDLTALSKEVGIPINLIISGTADKMSLGDLAHNTGGLIHSGNADIPETLKAFQSVFDDALRASFRIEDSWFDSPILFRYINGETKIEREFNFLGITAINAIASSTREPVEDIDYDPTNVIDRDSSTAWIEGAKGSGEGEWISVKFRHPEKIGSVLIQNGYWKNSLTLANNVRMYRVEIEFEDGIEVVTLEDPALDPTCFSKPKGYEYKLEKTHYSDYATITIKGVHPDRQYLETCLSYVGFYR
ncbi:MAG: hypothetical protein LBT59_20365 [Clostridiales bacterium]|nr:hypothetical protein [Clostridiales bacterium]